MVSCFFCTSLIPNTHAAEYYININSGNDETGDGSQGTPWQTLYHALSQVSDLGDTINMAEGTYSIATGEDELQHIIANDNLTIQGDVTGGTIIDGTGALNWSLGIEIYDPNSNITIRNLKIINFTTAIYISGSGYEFITDYVIELNKLNPQIPSRLTTVFTMWRKYDDQRQTLMKQQLERIKAEPKLSKDVYEIIDKSLAD